MMFELTLQFWEILVRSSIVYLVLILLVRMVPKRNAGHISPNDLLTLIVVGTVSTEAIIGGSTSILDILFMAAIILLWSWIVDQLEYRVPVLRKLLRHEASVLIENGRLNRRNMRRELVTEEELMANLRKEGVDSPARVRSAWLEADGEISFILAKGS
jgi:uncharacterized membrane protein YcaP (DUF421 family)